MSSSGAAGVSSSAGAAASVNNASGTSPMVNRHTYKTAIGNKSDIGWQHGIAMDDSGRIIQCKFCQKIVKGSVYRLKHHLAGTGKDVGPCLSVTDEVKKQMLENVVSLQKNLLNKSLPTSCDDEEGNEKKRNANEVVERSQSFFKRRGDVTQSTINNMFKKGLKDEVYDAIADFFYTCAIPFNAITTDEFQKMCDSIGRYGVGLKTPSLHDIRVKLLKKKYDMTKEIIEEHKRHWEKTGCTIMTDGWTDQRRRTIINFLVNSTKGTVFLKSIDASNISKNAEALFKMIDEVVEEVGEQNVIQIVTDNAANYKKAGEMLMEKRKKLYWTPCAAHCIDLMLEDFEKHIPVHHETIPKAKKITTYIYGRTYLICLLQKSTNGKDLIRPGITRFATSYLTLGCIHDNKSALIRMFNTDEWKGSQYAKSKDGKFCECVVIWTSSFGKTL